MSGASPPPAAPGRRYGGRTAEERQLDRRRQLVDAGVELFGTVGASGTSIRAVLRESGLAERYFSESFASLEDLLVAVHQHIHDQVLAAVRTATAQAGADDHARARAGVRAFIETVMSDERWVRIKLGALGDAPGEAALAYHRAAQEEFALLLLDYGPDERTVGSRFDRLALARAVVCGVESLVDAWASGSLATDLDGLVEHATLVITGVSRAVRSEA